MPLPKNDGLTPRQREVVQLKLQGYSTNQIAAILDVKYSAVRNYITTIYAKLGVRCREELYAKILDLHASDTRDREIER